MGARLHYLILDYLQHLEGAIIEIGSDNGERSTDFYAGLVYQLDRYNFYTIDLDENLYHRANHMAEKIPNMQAFLMSGEDFLKNVFPTFGKKICYAYLDNFDWNSHEGQPRSEWPNWMADIEDQYKKYGLELTQQNSANAHLEQTKLILNNCADKCVIQFDDTNGDGQTFTGKGMLAIPYLLDIGWNLIVCENGTVVMTNF